jgi:hypothetical protein
VREPLKVIGTSRTIGGQVTRYEVSPGDTITFTEIPSPQLDSAVVTGTAALSDRPKLRASKAPQAPPVSASAGQAEVVDGITTRAANGITTISWVDPVSGDRMTLSGRMSAAALQEIRVRIERDRAAAAATKKP